MKLNYQSLPSLQNVPKSERWSAYRAAYKALKSESTDFRAKMNKYKMIIFSLTLLSILSGLLSGIIQMSEKMLISTIVLSVVFAILIILKAFEMQIIMNGYIERFLSKQK